MPDGGEESVPADGSRPSVLGLCPHAVGHSTILSSVMGLRHRAPWGRRLLALQVSKESRRQDSALLVRYPVPGI